MIGGMEAEKPVRPGRAVTGRSSPSAAPGVATTDVWDTLSHDRLYRRAWPQKRVPEHLRTPAGNHLDPRVVEVSLGAHAWGWWRIALGAG